jgi:hypothetical protein
MTVVNRACRATGRAGVITSLSAERPNLARAPFTVTDRTVKACRSRSKRDNACVAVAVIVPVPLNALVLGVYAIEMA